MTTEIEKIINSKTMTGGCIMKEKNIQELAIRMGLITVEDMCQYTIAQLVVKIANKVNELVNEVWRFETDVQEILKTQNENIQYLLGEGLHLEVATVFERWIEDGTFDTLINQTALRKVNERIDETNARLSEKESKKTLYIRDYASTNDITSIIDEVLTVCKDNQFNLDLSGEWLLNNSVTIDFPITIKNGSIFVPSHESDGTSNHYTFVITSDNVNFDNVSIESNNDKIPQLNKRNSQMVGLASNAYFISATNVKNITVTNCVVNKMSGGTFTKCKNVTFDNCKMKMNETGIYAFQCVDFKFINSSVESSTKVESIYYHAFYMIENEDVNLSKLAITSSDDDYAINDIFHFYNPSGTATVKGLRAIVSDINVNGNFNRLAQINLHDNIIFSNVHGSFNSHIIQLNRGSQNISLNNCYFDIKRKLKKTALIYSTNFDDNNSCVVNSTKFNVLDSESGGFLDTCNVVYNNCEITTPITLSVAKSLNAGYVECNQCVFKTPRNITDMFNGTVGKYTYYSCIFECTNTAQYVSYNFNSDVVMRVINCFFTINKKLFDMSINNTNTVVYNSSGYYDGVGVEYKYFGQQAVGVE